MAFVENAARPSSATQEDDNAYGRARRRVFLLCALAVLAIGILYTVLQPTVYQSSATVLMSAPTAIDQQMLDADIQGVAIQRRTLTGSEITRTLADEVRDKYGVDLEPLALRRILDVAPVPETNLLELTASGSDSELLPPLLESWIDVYTSVRSRDIESRKSQTLTEVQDELDGLASKLESARSALEEYRAENEIISMERQENAVLAQLDGLNTSLNKAVEEEVRSQSYLATLQDSLAAGERVVPQSESSEVAAKAQQLAGLRTRLSELRARYTDDYILKDPRLREIPEQVDKLETELGEAYARGTQAELNNAERAYAAARESVANLSARLEDHKVAVAAFNTIYAKHEALVEDLARLEELNRSTQTRQVQIEVRQLEKYPQVSVIDWPAPEAERIGPPYLMLLGGTLVGSIVVGVFGVWLYSYLHPRSAQPAYVTLSGVHMYPQDAAQALAQIPGEVSRLEGAAAARLVHEQDAPPDPNSDGGTNALTDETESEATDDAQKNQAQ